MSIYRRRSHPLTHEWVRTNLQVDIIKSLDARNDLLMLLISNKYSPDRSLLLTIVIHGCVHASPVRRTSASRSLVLYQE